MRIGIIIICLALTSAVWGQGIDKDRMEKDLEVGENVLSALLKQDQDWPTRLLGKNEVEGEFIPDYGVVFTMEGNSWFGVFNDCEDCDEEDRRYVIAPKAKIINNNFFITIYF